ncbi:MAG: hypothetical protein V7690_05375 [Shewanella sp.]|jgi:hypothetical protein|uniref:hypothetical protein n=1 Tax=Shewanella sp. TaxID=50422 RepID=UPI0030021E96
MSLDAVSEKRYLNQLVKLGDMMGDGLHHEPGGNWISKEYTKICKALGYIPKTKRNPARAKAINEAMAKRVIDVKCGKCCLELKQTRAGSKRAECTNGHKWQLLK